MLRTGDEAAPVQAIRHRPQPRGGETPGSLDLEVPAAAERVAELRAAALAFAQDQGADRLDDIGVAISEACTNVVLHAYPSGEPGRVRLRGRRDGEYLVFTVTDAGRGLRLRPDSPGMGMGMHVMNATADRIEIRARDVGTEVDLVFRVDGPDR
jgi:serine/threonine-protein kinase RsbW